MIFKSNIQRIDDSNFEKAMPETFDNQCYSFHSQLEIGDSYKSSYSIKYVVDGYENYVINGITVSLGAGQGLLVNNRAEILVRSKGESIALFLSSDLINQAFKKITKSNATYAIPEPYRLVNEVPKTLIELFHQLGNITHPAIGHNFYETMAEYYILLQWKNINLPFRKAGEQLSKSYISDRVDVALEFILNTIDRKITLEDIAMESALSKYHLVRSFKNQFGITPIQLHLLLKIDKAKDMLIKSPRLKIKEIANAIGYSDIFSFSRHFKRTTRSSPKEYTSKFLIKSFS